MDGEIVNVYRLLIDDDVTSAERKRIRWRLERDGVNDDVLDDDFVTYQAFRTYVKKQRNTEYTPEELDAVECEVANIQQLRGWLVSGTK